jgi:hypothetical protein
LRFPLGGLSDVRHAGGNGPVKPKEIARWVSLRHQGMRRYVLTVGVVRTGFAFLLLGVLTTIMAFLDARQIIHDSGSPSVLGFSDYLATTLPFVPRLLLFAFGGGALSAVVMWFFMESRYRRAQRA